MYFTDYFVIQSLEFYTHIGGAEKDKCRKIQQYFIETGFSAGI